MYNSVTGSRVETVLQILFWDGDYFDCVGRERSIVFGIWPALEVTSWLGLGLAAEETIKYILPVSLQEELH